MIGRLFKSFLRFLFRLARKLKYQALSENTCKGPRPKMKQPLLLAGSGEISFGTNVKIGVSSSPNLYSSYCYIEARSVSAKIKIGRNTRINNNFSVISQSGSISVGQNCLIGHDVFIIDSDFHQLNPDLRHSGPKSMSQPVYIGSNVYIGSRAIILKNTVIGDGSVVAAGAVASGAFPSRSLIAGNPAKVIRAL